MEGLSYRLHCRKKRTNPLARVPDDTSAGPEEVILDENAIAEGQSQCVITGVRMSPDHKQLVYSVDFTGNVSQRRPLCLSFNAHARALT